VGVFEELMILGRGGGGDEYRDDDGGDDGDGELC
jgi:hypothetical protein